ncbi:MAG: peptidylprolyl isomerase [Candidatus Methylomirabilales bacterium]
MKARQRDKVRVHYKGTLEDGTVFDSSEGREPLEFEVGAGQVIEGFEKGVMGMKEGEEKQLSLPPEKAYGPHREDRVGKLPKEQVPDPNVQPGSSIQVQTKEGGLIQAKVLQVEEDGVVVDINHPLAGKTLNFEVRLVGLERGK